MGPVKIKFVVSFSSQDKLHKVSNLLAENSSPKRWLIDPQDRTGHIDAVFQLDRPCRFAFIDIGVIWCASLEVRVGKSDWPQGQSYVTLVPTRILMSQSESRLSKKTSHTCMFSKADFTEEGANDLSSWDRIQVVGRQPWRKDVQLGLSFLQVRCSDSLNPASGISVSPQSDTGYVQPERAFSVADIQRHFFGIKKDSDRENSELKKRLQKIAAGAEGVTVSPNVLSRNARMVLMANNCSKPDSPDQDSASQSSVFSAVQEPERSLIAKEVAHFLDTFDIATEDIESLKVSDLRHKYETLKRRKLTTEEKGTFYNCCQDFVGRTFDDDAYASATGAAITVCNGAVERGLQNRNECDIAAERAHSISRTSSSAGHGVSTPSTKDLKSINCSPQIPTSMTQKNIRLSGDGQHPRSDQRLSGGFLSSVFSTVDQIRDKSNVTPSEKSNSMSKSQDDRETATTGQNTSRRTSPAPMQTNRKESKDRTMSSEPSKCLDSESSSPQPTGSVSDSKINKSLLNSYKQFVNRRSENIPVSCVSKSDPSSVAAASSVYDDNPVSEEPGTPSESPVLSSSQVLTKKPEGILCNASKGVNPAKQQPEPSLAAIEVDVCSLVEDGLWLNSRGDSNWEGPRGGDKAGSGLLGRNSRLLYSSDESDSSPSPKSSKGTRGLKGKRRKAVKRRVETPTELATPDSGHGFLGEQQIGEDGAFANSRDTYDTEAVYVDCPLCQEAFPVGIIENHASGCTGPVKRRFEVSTEPTASTSSAVSPDAKRRLETPADLAAFFMSNPLSLAAESGYPLPDQVRVDKNDPYDSSDNAAKQKFDAVAYVNCPMCQIAYPEDIVELHAFDCTGLPCANDGADYVQCPFCRGFFERGVIEEHASHCG